MALKILLADDSMTAQNMGKKILAEAGYEVITVSNGAAAVKKIAELRPDIAVLDVFMPGYTGPEVCERMKNVHETAKIPVLLTVGKIEMGAFKAEEANRVKADGLIIKPFEASELLAAVKKLIAAPVAAPAPVDETPEYEKTIKIDVSEFRDDSYHAWKSNAEEHSDEHHPPTKPMPAMTQEMGAAPAFMDDTHATVISEYAPTVRLDNVTQLLANAAAAPASESPAPPPPPAMGFDLNAPAQVLEPAMSMEQAAGPAMGGFDLPPVAEAPAMGVEEIASTPALPDWALPTSGASNDADLPPLAMDASVQAHSELEVETTLAAAVEVPHEVAPDVEFTSARKDEHMDVVAAEEGLETHLHRSDHPPIDVSQDPSLVTDPSDLMAFTTKFGTANNSDNVVVGMASELPENLANAISDPATLDAAPEMAAMEAVAVPVGEIEPVTALEPAEAVEPVAEIAPAEPAMAAATMEALATEPPTLEMAPMVEVAPALSNQEFESRVAAAVQSGWKAEEHHLNTGEHSLDLEREMVKHYQQAAASSEPVAAMVPPPAVEAAAAPAGPDLELARAMAAAVGSEMSAGIVPAIAESAGGTMAMDADLIAEVVHRVTERMKPDLIAEITRELMKHKNK